MDGCGCCRPQHLTGDEEVKLLQPHQSERWVAVHGLSRRAPRGSVSELGGRGIICSSGWQQADRVIASVSPFRRPVGQVDYSAFSRPLSSSSSRRPASRTNTAWAMVHAKLNRHAGSLALPRRASLARGTPIVVVTM